MIERILKNLGRINGVSGSFIVGKDGLIIENEVPGDIDSELVADMASAVFGTAERSPPPAVRPHRENSSQSGRFRYLPAGAGCARNLP